MAASSDQFWAQVLQQVGAPVTAANIAWMNGWAAKEGTAAKNNPLATTLKTADSVALPGNSAGVQQYPTASEGATATATTLQSYPNIVSALKTGNILGVSFQNPPGLIHDFGVWSQGGRGAGTPTWNANALSYFQRVKVLAQGGQGGLSASDIGSFDLAAAGSAAKSAALSIPGVAQAESIASFLGKLSDPQYILRGLQIVGGSILVMVGLYLLARQVGLAPSAPGAIKAIAAKTPEGAVASAAASSGPSPSEARAARERRAEELHQQRVKTEAARATALRSRSRTQRMIANQRKEAAARREREAYFRGAADAGSSL